MPNPATDFSSAEEAEYAFYEALRNGDALAVMRVWAQEDQIVCIHPNGPRLQGWREVQSSWQAILDNGGLEVRATKQLCTVRGALAVHNLIEEITIRGQRNAEVVQCYATNVYIMVPTGWHMLMHHAAPADDDLSGPSSAGEVLH